MYLNAGILAIRNDFRLLRLGAVPDKNWVNKKHMKTIRKLAYVCVTPLLLLAIDAATADRELEHLFASLTGTGVNGGGFVYRYTSDGMQSTVASGVSRPNGLAFDHFGNLFVASTTFDGTSYQGTILEITPLGVQTTFASVGSDLYLVGLAIDSSDNVFVMALTSGPNFASIIYKFTP